MTTGPRPKRKRLLLTAWVGDDDKVHLTGQARKGAIGRWHIHVTQPAQDTKLRRWPAEDR